ncbi:putative manganese-dependent inorganic diphosphatase [Clostridium luticellarii]|jgi:manganese-dependent inorganic pyrophosphatase|uniref:inorganic diphosphatase n=1 Tax=Clostridium luticellarii TaxID=1691940 RepID=A0A2T0BRT5_9CLOT|nr:putative manganese-dependent inorganic diphosphatase [Clostridium luticellarii]MCI1943696.1 putative manganese-dependent inorganic diphosphatase [Clostridium luticellarii]MCI1968947.1 putative manganese-dependent inorganic diphosphatase [Clostridium luticellarii]MCI1994324.1 putative manganese-dependent inorganic diphosphatase [Clostridium luticellarii]MCI2038723.1 putative manganese-dependent inorganic diphosphatase [Clostridium luticellarii]PRR86598.1 Cobalt-dependent inorganic pyrophosph
MNDVVYITGHKNPDTDSICSSIAYAEFKNKMGSNAVPIRLGDLNSETKFVLDYFHVEPQKLVENVKPQISDLNIDIVNPISPETSLKTAREIIHSSNVKTLPVADDSGKLVGIVSRSDIASYYMDTLDANTSAGIIPQNISVDCVMKKDDIISFKTCELIDDVRDVMLKTRYRSYPVVDSENKVIGSISRDNLKSQKKKKIILVDHNEKAQSVSGLEDAEILEILDHHKIGDIQTGSPIYFRNEPVGCTATIVASRFFENGIEPSPKTAGLLCAAIISDTLLFRSPTSTDADKEVLKKLSSIAGIEPESFSTQMFKAGSSLDGKTPDDILNQDFKVFNISSTKIGVGQVSTMDTEGFNSVRDDVVNSMKSKHKAENFDMIILMVTNILKNGSELIVVGDDKDIIPKAFGVNLKGGSAYVPGILSRKKQVIPPLTAALS